MHLTRNTRVDFYDITGLHFLFQVLCGGGHLCGMLISIESERSFFDLQLYHKENMEYIESRKKYIMADIGLTRHFKQFIIWHPGEGNLETASS